MVITAIVAAVVITMTAASSSVAPVVHWVGNVVRLIDKIKVLTDYPSDSLE